MSLIIVLLVAIFIFIYRYKKNKPQIDAFIAKEKEKDLIKDKRRETKRRKWALAIGDIVARRNGLSVNGFTLDLKLTDDKRQQLALQVKQELGTETYQSNEDFRQQIGVILQRWATGLGNSPHDFYEQLAAQGQVLDGLAFDCMRTAFLTRCIAGLGWCDENQAWIVLLLNAQRAQDCFASWEDYASAYVRARQKWLMIYDTPVATANRDLKEVTAWLKDPSSNWKKLPWNEFKIFEPN